jgi:hypothetical protein
MNRTPRIALLALALVGLAACTTSPPVAQDIAAVEVALTASEQLALVYTSLPRCGSAGASALCSSQATVDAIKKADNTAYSAVIAARSNSALISAAVTAISGLRSAIPATTPPPTGG